MKNVIENNCSDNKYRYTIGEFDGYANAKKELEKVHETRFKDAFVIRKESFYKKHCNNNDLASVTKLIKTNFNPTGESFYSVQIASSINLVESSSFKNVENLQSCKTNNGYYKYFFGKFDGYQTAKDQLEKTREFYSDAFIISYTECNLETIENTTVNNIDSEYKFTIQIASVQKPNRLSDKKGLDAISETEGSKFFIYTYGKFKTLKETREALKEVKEAGFKDAFINSLSKYN